MSRDEDAEIQKNYQHSHCIVPQSAERQQTLSGFYEMQDNVEQPLLSVNPFHTTNGTHGMLNTILQEMSSENSRSNETKVTDASVLSERNPYQVPSFSPDGNSTSYVRYDVQLNADIGDGNRNASVPTGNHDLVSNDRDKALYTTFEPVTLDCIRGAGCCKHEPNVSASSMREDFNQQSTCYSVSVSNGKANCTAFDSRDPAFQLRTSPADVDKVRCILRNIVRDWAPEGAIERNQCYQPVLDELQRHFPNRSRDKPPSCLVPGAGLARLALEISLLGFVSQGNEFSYYMMICSSFILN
ncbi:hypothetical protein KI387_036378, partial [Taxus chinensis]